LSRVILPVKRDVIFKIYFADKRNIEFLTDFLKATLPIPADEYDELVVVDPHLVRDFADDKLGIVDVKLKTVSGKTIHIDIQVAPFPHMKSRIAYYDAKMITEQLGKGEDYKNIKQVISIIITEDEFIPNSPNCHHRFTMYDKENSVELTDIVEVHTLELCKVPPLLQEAPEDNRLYNWLRFINAEEEIELEAVAQRDPIIKQAVLKLMELSDDERARMLLDKREMERMDESVREEAARIEGEKTKALTIAKNALQMKIPIDDVIKLTGLARQEIEDAD
jgi:predicted transposase/invertase (TIGR01784 family)